MDEKKMLRQYERAFSKIVSASLDYFRDVRDAASEAMFFQTYGSMAPMESGENGKPTAAEGNRLSTSHQPSAKLAKGGYAEALSRAAYLLSEKGRRLPLTQFEIKKKLRTRLGDLLPKLSPEEIRVIRGNQDVICRNQPEEALNTLPVLLSDPSDRENFLTILDAVVNDYSETFGMTSTQAAMLRRIRQVLSGEELVLAS
jgi:hypothetical protein